MVFDISIAVIAAAVAVLAVFLVITLIQTKKTLKSTKQDLHKVSLEAVSLMERLEELTKDIQSKSEALNFAFRPLKKLNQEKSDRRGSYTSGEETAEQVLELVSTSIILYNKIKAAVKEHGR